MGFSWVQSISVGAEATKATMDEIRTNVDWLKDNLSCGVEHTTDESSKNVSYNNAVQSGLNASRNTALHSKN